MVHVVDSKVTRRFGEYLAKHITRVSVICCVSEQNRCRLLWQVGSFHYTGNSFPFRSKLTVFCAILTRDTSFDHVHYPTPSTDEDELGF